MNIKLKQKQETAQTLNTKDNKYDKESFLLHKSVVYLFFPDNTATSLERMTISDLPLSDNIFNIKEIMKELLITYLQMDVSLYAQI